MPKKSRPHDPGGKVKLVLKDGIVGTAHFGGANNEYRYGLSRTWEADKPYVLFVLMNPSTADPNNDDPTIAKCCRFAKEWGFGGILAANTFAYRCTDQKRLLESADPIGPDNDKHIIEMAKKAAVVIFAYGKPRYKQLRSRGRSLVDLLIQKAGITPHVLRLGKDGTPCHPLYLPKTLKPTIWKP